MKLYIKYMVSLRCKMVVKEELKKLQLDGAIELGVVELEREITAEQREALKQSLAKSGLEIVGRTPLEAPINSDNHRYLTAKATRAGHLLNHPLAEPSKRDRVTT